MRYLQLAAIPLAALALAACKPAATTPDSAPIPSPAPAPMTPDAPSAPVVPPQTKTTEPVAAPQDGAKQTLHFVGPMDLTISLSTEDNFATAVMTDNSDRRVQMYSVPSASGVRLEDGEGITIHFKNGEGYVEFSPGNTTDIQEFRSP